MYCYSFKGINTFYSKPNYFLGASRVSTARLACLSVSMQTHRTATGNIGDMVIIITDW